MENQNIYYVYQYLDPRTMQPFYIGKGKKDRYLKHMNETKENTENYKKWCYIEGLRNKNLEPVIQKIKEGLTEADAYKLEDELIKKYGRKDIDIDGILTNMNIGQIPPHHPWTDERREAARIRATNRIITDQMRQKCRSINLGRKVTNETKKNMSIAAKNRIARDGNPMQGRKHSPKTLELLSKKAKGRILSKIQCQHCNKMSDPGNHAKNHGDKCKVNPKYDPLSAKPGPMTGKKHSIKTKEKMSAAQKNRSTYK